MDQGDRVRMSEALKARLRGACGVEGKHLGPFTDGDGAEGDCYGCSSAHAEEFGECVGIAIGLTDYNNVPANDAAYELRKVGPEWDVRWQPSNLRYAYDPSALQPASLGFTETTCESCHKAIYVAEDDRVPATFCPACGGGCKFGGYVV